MALNLLHLSPDYAGLRLVGLLCTLASIAFQYGALHRLFGAAVARVAILPVLIGTALMVEPDYVHYSSELVSILLLSMAFYGLAVLWSLRTASKRLTLIAFGTGLALGALPYAKLQSAPIGFLLGTVALGWLAFRIRQHDTSARPLFAGLAIGALGCSLFLAVVLSWLALWPEFCKRYVLGNIAFGTELFPWTLYRITEDIIWLPTNSLPLKALVAAAFVPGLTCVWACAACGRVNGHGSCWH